MASSMCYYTPNPTMNSATFTAEPQLCNSLRQDLPMIKSKYLSNLLSHNYLQSRIVDSVISTKSTETKLEKIIRYRAFVTACYRAFDLNPNSKRYLNCKYGRKKKKSKLTEVGLGDSGYEVTKYIYVTAPDVKPMQTCFGARWIGYVTASTDNQVSVLGRRDILITVRGTVTNTTWMANLMSSLPPVKIEAGFLSLYTSNESSGKFGIKSCRDSRTAFVRSDEGTKQKIPLTVFSFSRRRVGNSWFKERCEESGVKILRIVNVNDPITKLPGVVSNENFRVELLLDFLKMDNPSCVHDLENYIDLLKYPKRDDHEKISLMERAKRFLFGGAQRMQWRSAAINILNLVQCQWT
ncbi:putative lipase [Handroanthus impetiginosus]|uniref:Putative lipase n=1 Tax=Handroanthus impetiginosus TaxID=429701 RepID=A0A2G9HW39_9LAMI|nr:putative lipase [Handroanthus impetiginosus]